MGLRGVVLAVFLCGAGLAAAIGAVSAAPNGVRIPHTGGGELDSRLVGVAQSARARGAPAGLDAARAQSLDVSPATVKRDWLAARAWLYGQLHGEQA